MGFGFLEFDSVETATNVCRDLQGTILDGHALILQLCHAKKDEVPKKVDNDKSSTKLLVKNVAFEATEKELRQLFSPFGQVIEIQASVHRCTATVDFMLEKMRPYPATVNDEAMYKHAKSVGETLLGQPNVQVLPKAMGAENFSFYAEKMAAASFMIRTKNEMFESKTDLNSPFLVIDEEVLPIGAAFHAAVLARSYLDNVDAVVTHRGI